MQVKLGGNRVLLVGFAHRDAELKRVGSKDTALCNFSLIVGKDADGKNVFANCKAWRDMGLVASSVRSGDTVLAIGEIEEREYNDKVYKDLVCEFVDIAKVKPVEFPGATYVDPSVDGPAPFGDLDPNDDGLPY